LTMGMSPASFLLELRRRTRASPVSRDPLADARSFLAAHGATAEGQVLRKVLTTLATRDGEFAEPEVWRCSAETLAIVAALVDARFEGRYSEDEWA
jgi:hypothetical protein